VQIGKNTGDDFRERKLTLPVIRAVATADAAERAFWVRTIEKGDQGDGDLDHAMEILRRHGTLEQTREEAHRHAADARAALADVPSHDVDRHDGGPGRLRGCAPDLIAGQTARCVRTGAASTHQSGESDRSRSAPSRAALIGEDAEAGRARPAHPRQAASLRPASASRTSPTAGTRDAAAGSRSFPWSLQASQQAVGIGPFRLGSGAFSTDANALKTGPVGTSTPG
jgi:hypothetical protein